MIAHVMLMDKKLDATLPVIAVLDRARPFASWVVLLCAAVYFWEVLSTRVPMFQRWKRSREPISLSLDRAAEEAG
jgi:hypothetical protein